MDEYAGYVRLHRSLLRWEWYDDDACLRLLIHLLMRVNWRPGRFRGMDVHPGQVVTSMERMAEGMGWSRSKLRNTMDKLRRSGDLTTTTTNHWTVVTLVNWAKYQNGDQPHVQPTADHRPSEQPTNSQPPATIEEGKKERREEGKKDSLAAKPPKRTLDWFKAECRRVADANPDLLDKSEHKPFYDYWTEASPSGALRFQGEKYFDVKRRMQTWQRNANAKPSFASKPAEMTRKEALQVCEDIRAKNGIPPGGPLETHLIPAHIREILSKPAPL